MPIKKRIRFNSPPEVIAKRITETREARRISASELARLVGVTATAVWNWEKNAVTPRRPALEQVAKVLGVSVSFLMTGEKEEIGEIQPPSPTTAESVSTILDDARTRLSLATGMTLERIKLNVQFVAE
ncbi:MAG: helix-turn-helix domain-containing protein [Bradyrhizobium sp.]